MPPCPFPEVAMHTSLKPLFHLAMCLTLLFTAGTAGKCSCSAEDRKQFAELSGKYLSANRHRDLASLASLTTRNFILVWPGHKEIDRRQLLSPAKLPTQSNQTDARSKVTVISCDISGRVAIVVIRASTVLTSGVSQKMEILDSEQNTWQKTARGWKLKRIYRYNRTLRLFSG